MYHHAVTYNPDIGVPGYFSIGDIAAGNCSDSRNSEYSPYFDIPDKYFPILRLKHTLHGSFNILNGVINHPVKPHINVQAFGQFLDISARPYIKTNNQCVRNL